ncbi:taste receptor type 2 member 9-like [Heliangelus exortis]|uniref:taste receptor type 2 member 9-like n=1 Tax=Heliangelus exortis TaxID=472823 RepID=UPI003A8DC8C3
MEACSSPEKLNVTTYNAVAMAIITLQTFAGMWINAFIVSVLCVAWGKKRSFNSNEKILLVLGCSRFWYSCITWVFTFLERIYPSCLDVSPILQIFLGIQSLFNFSNLWVSAFLFVFYCIKIANFRHTFFIYLKVRVDRIVPWLMLTSVLVSLSYGIYVYEVMDEVICEKSNCTTPGNFWKQRMGISQYIFTLFFLSGFAYATAFIAVISSALLLLFSLWKHKCKMQTKSGKNVSVDAHIKAVKSIISFLLIYSINFVCLILSLIYRIKRGSGVPYFISLLQHAFPAVHSIILVFSNPKLEKTLLRTLSCAKCKICKN